MNMKKMTIKKYIVAGALLLTVSACDMNLEPYDSKTNDAALSTVGDLQTATYGTYAGLVHADYTRVQHFLGEYPGDNVTLSGTTSDPLYNIYNYTDFPGNPRTEAFWRQAYKTIFSANQVIEHIEDGKSAAMDQLKGENLWVRAMVHLELVRFFARPYTQGENNPGIVIMNSTKGDEFPKRSTVKEVYDFIIADLLKAADLMTEDKSSIYASKQVANALLARVYLYKGDNENAVLYATKVIESGKYSLMDTEPYKTYFTGVPESNPETIFAVRHTVADNRKKSAIGSMYYNDPVTHSTGWGEIYASMAFVKLLDKYPNDARHAFIELQLDENGDTLRRGNVPKYFINKYNWQEGVANLSSPVYLRLAGMYLIRAEANAKLGNDQLALDDVNVIRERAGLTGTELYTLGDLKGHASVFDVVLEERRLELAFECQRPTDLFRNNLPVIRAYPGFHSQDRYHQTILPTDDRVVFFIPEREVIVNPNLEQNP